MLPTMTSMEKFFCWHISKFVKALQYSRLDAEILTRSDLIAISSCKRHTHLSFSPRGFARSRSSWITWTELWKYIYIQEIWGLIQYEDIVPRVYKIPLWRKDSLKIILSPQWEFLYWWYDIFILNQRPVCFNWTSESFKEYIVHSWQVMPNYRNFPLILL